METEVFSTFRGPRPLAGQAASREDSCPALRNVFSNLAVFSAHCRLHFDREVLLLPSGACACARGVAGHLLTARAPEMTKQFFKPGQGGDAPAAFVLRPDSFGNGRGRSFSFSVFSWEPTGAFLENLMGAWSESQGRPWGGTGAQIVGFEASEPERLAFEGTSDDLAIPLRLRLHTPLAIKTHVRDRPPGPDGKVRSHRRLLGPDEITFGRIVQALVARINNLSAHFGNGASVAPQPFLAAAALVREVQREFRMVEISRRSSSQRKEIHLNGVIGRIDLGPVPPLLLDLLGLGAVFHLGHRTADGCGCLGIEPRESSRPEERTKRVAAAPKA